MLRKYFVPMMSVLFYVACFIAFQIKTYHEIGPHYWTTFFSIDGARLLATGLLLPGLGICGLWFAHHRSEQTKEQISLQIKSQDQQRFFDAVRLLDSNQTATRLGALETINQMSQYEGFEFFEEALPIIKEYMKEHSSSIKWSASEFPIVEDKDHASPLINKAFLTLVEIIKRRQDAERQHFVPFRDLPIYLEDVRLREIRVPFSFHRKFGENRKEIRNVHLSRCDMRECRFFGAEFKHVQFGSKSDKSHSVDLTDASFAGAKFDNVYFDCANISGVNFAGACGLDSVYLGNCYFASNNPPKNLPANIKLRWPVFSIMEVSGLGRPARVVSNPMLEDEFLAQNPSFERDENGCLVTLAPESS